MLGCNSLNLATAPTAWSKRFPPSRAYINTVHDHYHHSRNDSHRLGLHYVRWIHIRFRSLTPLTSNALKLHSHNYLRQRVEHDHFWCCTLTGCYLRIKMVQSLGSASHSVKDIHLRRYNDCDWFGATSIPSSSFFIIWYLLRL